jgi:hypothetical protein
MERDLSSTFDVVVLGGLLRSIVFANGEALARKAMFFKSGSGRDLL